MKLRMITKSPSLFVCVISMKLNWKKMLRGISDLRGIWFAAGPRCLQMLQLSQGLFITTRFDMFLH